MATDAQYPGIPSNIWTDNEWDVEHGPNRRRTRPNDLILRLARGQHGVVSRRQLLFAGVTSTTLQQRITSGLLVPIFDGVYATGAGVLTHLGICMAATLTGPEGSILSHRSAAALHGLTPISGGVVDVIRPGGRTHRQFDRRPAGPTAGWLLRIHRSRDLPEREITTVSGIRVTSVERTLLNFAAESSETQLRSAVAAGERQRTIKAEEAEKTGQRGPGWKGILRYRRTALQPDLGDPQTSSALEIRFRQFCREFNIDLSAVNIQMGEFRVDCVWEPARLIVEVDSWTHHQSREAFENDRRRDRLNQDRGYRTMRITDRAMSHHAEETAALLRRAISQSSGSTIPSVL